MAYGILSPPGTDYGPCSTLCSHQDCLETRRRSQELCPFCKKPIGYDVPFTHYENQTWHLSCLQDHIEMES